MKGVAAFLLVLCYLAGSHAWNCGQVQGPSKVVQIDAGLGKVVAVDSAKKAFFLSGTTWFPLGTVALKHVSVGPAGLWGASPDNKVYKYIAGDFKVAPGALLQQVDAGGDHQVVGVGFRVFWPHLPHSGNNVLLPSSGVNALHPIAKRSLRIIGRRVPIRPLIRFSSHCLRNSLALTYKGMGSLSWSSLSRTLRYYSCSPNHGCWGIDQSFRVYVTKIISPSSCRTSGWTHVSGPSMTMIEVSTDGRVFGVTRTGQVFQRVGISSSSLPGTKWQLVKRSERIRHVSYDLGHLWLVTSSGSLLKCTL